MPKSKQSDLIVSKYSDDGVSNNILSKEIYEKYSPCKSKFIASSHTKKYISGKLDRAIRQIKYDKKEVTDVVDNKMVVDIWNALCPLLDNEIKVPKGLTKDVFELIDFKTKAYTNPKKSKKGKSSTQYYDSDESEKDSETSSSEEDKLVSNKTKKMKMKPKSKPKSHKDTSESEQDSEASSSEDEKPAPKKTESPKGHKKSKQKVSEPETSSESESD
jgi:hypothetical protein